MRDRDTIDDELRLLAAVRWSIREQGGEPSSRHIDDLLDERLPQCYSGRQQRLIRRMSRRRQCSDIR